MHQARPHGVFVHGGSLTEEDAAALELLSRRLTNLREVSGLPSFKMVRTLPDGSMAIAQDAGGVFRAFVVKAPAVPQAVSDGRAKAYIPMLFSGVVTRAVVRPDEGVELMLTECARRRIAGYAPGKLVAKRQELKRFAIDYNLLVQEFAPKDPSVFKFTQYAQQRPTWYSGAMAEVMQIVGGYGRQDLAELPDTPVERARMVIPGDVMAAIEQQMGNVRLPGYTGLPPKNGQFQFDYKYHNTHLVGFDNQGQPWLARVSAAGVYVMPLPVVPATTTAAFREYVEKQNDDELLAILDRFGGMPSGEAMPTESEDFEAWRRAGVIVKVCDTADFYAHIAYSTACGWSMNTSGTEGIATCYDYYDEEGLGYGLAYKLKLQLAAAPGNGRIPLPKIEGSDDPRVLNEYLAAIFRRTNGQTAEHLAIRYKLRRTSFDELLGRAATQLKNGDVSEAEIDYWRNLEMDPIAAHTGSVTEIGRGYLYHPAKKGPQIKFPEPFVGACVSHDFRPLINGRGKSNYPRSDTIMFGYYVGDQLKVVKYFRDDRTYTRDVEDNYEECMIVGSWERTVTNTPVSLMGNFYTSDFDDRETGAESTTVTTIVGKDLGYDSQPCFGFDAPFWKPGTMWRNRYFSRQTTTREINGYSLGVAVCIPYLCRNAVLHATSRSTARGSVSDTLGRNAVMDPYTYRFWTYDFVMHWSGGLPVMKGKPYPKDGSPVWVEIENYNPGPCSDFADNGPWVPGLPADYTWLIHPKAGEWKLSGGGGPPTVNSYTRTTTTPATTKERLDIGLMEQPQYVHDHPNIMYFLPSPDEYAGFFYRDAAKVLFGNATYGNVSETLSAEDTQRVRFGYTSLADNKSAHHFIGVINE